MTVWGRRRWFPFPTLLYKGDTKMPRGRPRKKKANVAKLVAKEVAVEVDPKIEHQKKLLREDDERKKAPSTVVDTWFTLRNKKLVKCIRKSNGNVYSIFAGMQKNCKDQIEQLQKDGMLRLTV